jgi:hypothetical protein
MVKRETALAAYDGANEIGGNLVKDGDTEIFFHFGMSFSMKNRIVLGVCLCRYGLPRQGKTV